MAQAQGGQGGNQPDPWYQVGQWVRNHGRTVAKITGALCLGGAIYWWGYTNGRPDTDIPERVSYVPSRSLIEYKMEEHELPEIIRLIKVAESVIMRRCGKRPYRKWVWEAGITDPETGELDLRNFDEEGYARVNTGIYENVNELADNYQRLNGRRRR